MRAKLIWVTAAFTVACGSSAVRPAAASSACRPSGARILASDTRGVVYALKGSVYGCDLGTSRRTRLGNTKSCVAAALVNHVALAGDLVAYGVQRCGVDTGTASVSVLRLSDGKRLRGFAAVSGAIGPESFESVTDIVVKRDAAVAWIATVSSIIGHGMNVEVQANGKLLDSGADIKPHSLQLRGSKLTWRHGSVTRSASLS